MPFPLIVALTAFLQGLLHAFHFAHSAISSVLADSGFLLRPDGAFKNDLGLTKLSTGRDGAQSAVCTLGSSDGASRRRMWGCLNSGATDWRLNHAPIFRYFHTLTYCNIGDCHDSAMPCVFAGRKTVGECMDLGNLAEKRSHAAVHMKHRTSRRRRRRGKGKGALCSFRANVPEQSLFPACCS